MTFDVSEFEMKLKENKEIFKKLEENSPPWIFMQGWICCGDYVKERYYDNG